MKRMLLVFSLAAAVLPLGAQTLSKSSETTLGGFKGTMSYGYRISGGKEVLEGKKSFSARAGDDTYILEANYKNGLLDGAASAKLHRSYMASGRDAGVLKIWKATLDVTLTARFHEGKLAGMLTCDYTPSGSDQAGLSDMNKRSFSGNYRDGKLCGTYSYLNYAIPGRVVYTGSTDGDGLADGKWQVYEPAIGEMQVYIYQHGVTATDVNSSAVRNCIAGKITPQQLFEDYAYRKTELDWMFTEAAQYFDYITENWLKGCREVIPFTFGVTEWSGDIVQSVSDIHKTRVVNYLAVPVSFSKEGYTRMRDRYFDSISGGQPLDGATLHLDGENPHMTIAAESLDAWKPMLRIAQGYVPKGDVDVTLADFQVAGLKDSEALDAVRRKNALNASALLGTESPYSVMFTEGKTPTDLVAGEKGAERIAKVATEAREYAVSVKNAIMSLPRTQDGKFLIKDKHYYAVPTWDVNYAIADADRILQTCREAGKLYDQGLEYASARTDLKSSYEAYCGKIAGGNYETVVGAMDDARYFVDRVVTPDILGKVGSNDEMKGALSDKMYKYYISIYPAAPAANFRDRQGLDEFILKTNEYAGYQRSAMEYDALLNDIYAQKANLDAELSGRTYKAASVAVNEKLAGFPLQPTFRTVEEYSSYKSQAEGCLAVIRDARAYAEAHKEYEKESGNLRDLLSASKTSHISKFYRSLSKNFKLDWDNTAPIGACSANVRDALDVTRRISAVVSSPKATEKDSAIKGLSSPDAIWAILEAQ